MQHSSGKQKALFVLSVMVIFLFCWLVQKENPRDINIIIFLLLSLQQNWRCLLLFCRLVGFPELPSPTIKPERVINRLWWELESFLKIITQYNPLLLSESSHSCSPSSLWTLPPASWFKLNSDAILGYCKTHADLSAIYC